MSDALRALVATGSEPGQQINLVREYMQARILQLLSGVNAFDGLALLGGTALRFLHDLPRFSHDIDLAPIHRRDVGTATERRFGEWMRSVAEGLAADGQAIEIARSAAGTLLRADAVFPDLLAELGVAAPERSPLVVQIEIDTDPPAGAVVESRDITRHFTFALRAHDLASCMANKVHNLIIRERTKGRDVFDLAWYLEHPACPSPNPELLGDSLARSGRPQVEQETAPWRRAIAARLVALDWAAAIADVDPFLASRDDRQLLDRRRLEQALAPARRL